MKRSWKGFCIAKAAELFNIIKRDANEIPLDPVDASESNHSDVNCTDLQYEEKKLEVKQIQVVIKQRRA